MTLNSLFYLLHIIDARRRVARVPRVTRRQATVLPAASDLPYVPILGRVDDKGGGFTRYGPSESSHAVVLRSTRPFGFGTVLNPQALCSRLVQVW
jgi:hypothetical protein